MRGADVTQERLFTVKQLKDFVPTDHLLKPIRAMLDEALRSMDSVFAQMYSIEGRESIPPERLLRALALQALYSVRSERMLCEQLRYNLLFRWFVGLSMDDEPWDHSTFSKNRERLIADDVIRKLFVAVLKQARGAGLLSKEHFSVDGTLIRAWASHKSFQPRKGPKPPRSGPPSNPEVDFKGTKRHRDTHESSSDPDAFEYTKSRGVAPVPAYLGHVLMENRSGLAVDCRLTQAEGTSEREAALEMLEAVNTGSQRITVGADKAYDHAAFVKGCREINVVPHVAQNTTNRSSAIDGRTTRHPGYEASLWMRRLIETLFTEKQHGTLRQVKVRGSDRVSDAFTMSMMVANLRRMARLVGRPAGLATG